MAQAREQAADATELAAATDGRLRDHPATVLAARYALALAGWNGEVNGDFRRTLGALRGLCQDIVAPRRGDQSGARLRIERERLERGRENVEAEAVALFERWVKNPAVREWILEEWISPEEHRRQMWKSIWPIGEVAGISSSLGDRVKPRQISSNRIRRRTARSNRTQSTRLILTWCRPSTCARNFSLVTRPGSPIPLAA